MPKVNRWPPAQTGRLVNSAVLGAQRTSHCCECSPGRTGYAASFANLGLTLRAVDTAGGHWHYWSAILSTVPRSLLCICCLLLLLRCKVCRQQEAGLCRSPEGYRTAVARIWASIEIVVPRRSTPWLPSWTTSTTAGITRRSITRRRSWWWRCCLGTDPAGAPATVVTLPRAVGAADDGDGLPCGISLSRGQYDAFPTPVPLRIGPRNTCSACAGPVTFQGNFLLGIRNWNPNSAPPKAVECSSCDGLGAEILTEN